MWHSERHSEERLPLLQKKPSKMKTFSSFVIWAEFHSPIMKYTVLYTTHVFVCVCLLFVSKVCVCLHIWSVCPVAGLLLCTGGRNTFASPQRDWLHRCKQASLISTSGRMWGGVWSLFRKLRKTLATIPLHTKSQGQILAVWILAAKLPNSNLNFAVDFWVDFPPM